MQELTLAIQGMSCGHCVARVSKTLTAQSGVVVDDVEVGRARVRFDPQKTSAADIARAVEDAGYPASPAPA